MESPVNKRGSSQKGTMTELQSGIAVVQGLIVSSNAQNVLMAHRPPGKKKPLMWEYPGGKVEPNETLQEALKRELREELDIDVKIGKLLSMYEFHWKEDIDLYLFAIEDWSGDPKPLVATELRWVDPEYAIDNMPLLPGAFASYREVIAYLRGLK